MTTLVDDVVKASQFSNGAFAMLALVTLGSAGCERKAPPSDPPGAPGFVDAGAPALKALATPDAGAGPAVMVEIPEVRVRSSGETTIHVSWVTPPGTIVNDDAPFRVRWNRSDGLYEAPNDVKATGSTVKEGFRVKVQPMTGAPNATLSGEISIVVCDSVTHSVCVPVRRSVELGFVVAKDAAAEATVAIPLPAAK